MKKSNFYVIIVLKQRLEKTVPNDPRAGIIWHHRVCKAPGENPAPTLRYFGKPEIQMGLTLIRLFLVRASFIVKVQTVHAGLRERHTDGFATDKVFLVKSKFHS